MDTSAFYGFLDASDDFHPECRRLFLKAEAEGWRLVTSSFVVHESWAIIQARLGCAAVEDWLNGLVARCEIIWVDANTYARSAAQCRQARERRLSLTDCVSFEVMLELGCRDVLADDEHFRRQGFTLPE